MRSWFWFTFLFAFMCANGPGEVVSAGWVAALIFCLLTQEVFRKERR
jgi:hypothetical protein